MGKYIDAEKLIAEIERLLKCTEPHRGEAVADGSRQTLYWIKDLITSLQQEQSEGLHFTPLNRLIQKIPSKNWNDTVNGCAKKLRDCLIKEGYRKDAEVLQGYISYMNGNNVPMSTMDEQDQLEVDLNGKVTFDNKTILRVETDEKKKRVLEIIGLEESCCNYPLNYENETDDCYYEEYNDRIYIDGNITFNQMREIVEYIENK